MTDAQVELMERVCRLLEQHTEEPLRLKDLGEAVGLSPGHLQRLFKRHLGISPRQYADACRLGLFKKRLRAGGNVTTAIYEAGYGSSSRLYEKAPQHLGMTPGEYGKGGARANIRYTVTDCVLGRLLLAGTDRGVCAVYLGDNEATLEQELAREFHAAERQRDDNGLSAWARGVRDQLSGGPDADLPLDVRATAFQWRVWQELRKIPRGQTRTYKQIAEQLGKPTASRAVARACATNPVSVIVPCHRVIRGDGGLGGYRWGLDRKTTILRKETQCLRETEL